MKTKEDIIAYGLSLPGTYLDYPFDERTAALRHQKNRKMFALFTQNKEKPLLNLKCEPMQADFWRQIYPDVIPAYHMNKTHWNSICLEGDIPDADLLTMIENSYRLTLR